MSGRGEERRQATGWQAERTKAEWAEYAADLEAEIERLRSQLAAARYEAQAATKLILEHQSKNCHLHAENERLRAEVEAWRDRFKTCGFDGQSIVAGG